MKHANSYTSTILSNGTNLLSNGTNLLAINEVSEASTKRARLLDANADRKLGISCGSEGLKTPKTA